MFKAYAHRNTFSLDVNARGVEVAIYIACRVPSGKDDRTTKDTPSVSFYTYYTITLHDEAVHAGLKVYLTTAAAYGLTHIFNHAGQLIGTDVRMRIAQYRCRRSVLAEYIENLIHITTLLAARIEFAIRVGTCTALTKAIVALGVNGVFARDTGNISLAGMYILSALHHDGTAAQLDKAQGSKESTRTSAHHDDFRSLIYHRVVGLGVFIIGRQLIDVESHSKVDKDCALASIDAAFQGAHRLDGAGVKSLLAGYILFDALLVSRLLGQNA